MYSYEELKAKYGDLFDEQLFIESKEKIMAEQRTLLMYEKSEAEQQNATTQLGQHYIKVAYNNAYEAVKLFVDTKLEPKPGVKPAYTSILLDLAEIYKNDMEELYNVLALSTLSTLISLASNYNETNISNVAHCISIEIKAEFDLKHYIRHAKSPIGVMAGVDKRVAATYRRTYIHSCMKKDNYTPIKWSKQNLIALCGYLISIVCDTTGYFKLISYGTQNITSIVPTEIFLTSWSKNLTKIIDNSYHPCPMIIPPADWTSFDDGGYYGDLKPIANMLRCHRIHSYFGKTYLQRLSQTQIDNVTKALNAIQSTPWKINKRVLEVVEALKDLGGDRAGLPPFVAPPKPATLSEEPTEEELIHYKEVMIPYHKEETRRKSLVCRALSTISVAKKFKDYERIYFPHNMDFRGRVYPLTTFSPQGDDLTKSLLLFADTPPCDSMEDIEWLMIHGANLAGVDKVSYTERIQWVYDHEHFILASAADPLSCDWWEHQDCPCQMLAWCFEWAAWKEWEATHKGDPKGFVSGMPIAMDGTCSGLQHFSAILRDPIGGTAVNLVPGEKPSDIYAIVAQKVKKMLDKDICNGTADEMQDTKIKYGTKSLAQLWVLYATADTKEEYPEMSVEEIWEAKGLSRSVTKRPTMTLAYGAKEFGFRDQIMEDTIEKDIIKRKDTSVFNKYNKWQASAYMAKLIWAAVGQTVVKALEGMKWLQTCAKEVVKGGRVVTWTTPMGLPVQQHYLKVKTKNIRMRCAGRFLRLYTPEFTGDVDKTKQSSGIAPNFIHSMDAAHLQYTVCRSVDANIHHFAMIHDSYGSPVSQAKLMYKVVRQAFVDMYTERDVLEDFRRDMQVFTDKQLPPPPKKGTLDLNTVLESKYIFC